MLLLYCKTRHFIKYLFVSKYNSVFIILIWSFDNIIKKNSEIILLIRSQSSLIKTARTQISINRILLRQFKAQHNTQHCFCILMNAPNDMYVLKLCALSLRERWEGARIPFCSRWAQPFQLVCRQRQFVFWLGIDRLE